MTSTRLERCRFCGNANLLPAIDLGPQYLSSLFPSTIDYRSEFTREPLDLVLCEKSTTTCGILQLGHSFDMSRMYEHYPFTSSTNTSMPRILLDVLDAALAHVELRPGDLVLDIGGNDGTLLSFLRDRDCDLLCIDAAHNISPVFESPRFRTVRGHFTEDLYTRATPKKAALVFSIAMFYHLYDPVQFAREVAQCMADDGVWVIQMAHLPAMLQTNMYDNIVHEHVGYYATDHMKWVMEQAGLQIFDVTLNEVYGGSFRLFISKKGSKRHPVTDRYRNELAKDSALGIYRHETYRLFMNRIVQTRETLLGICDRIKSDGKSLWIYGASTKGNTILQFCGLGREHIEAAADSNAFKFNKFIIGADVPIKSEDEMRKVRPDYLLALPYSFIDAFRKREAALLARGTRFIVPLPEARILEEPVSTP